MPQQKDFLTDEEMEALLAKQTGQESDFISDAQMEEISKRPIGATGEFTEPSALGQVGRIALGPIAGLVRGGIEGIKEAVTSPIAIAEAAGRPAETESELRSQMFGGGIGLLLNRLIIQPTVDNAEQLASSLANEDPDVISAYLGYVGMVPVVGPMAKGLLEQALGGDVSGAIGKGAVYAVTPKVVRGATRKVSGKVSKFREYISKKVESSQGRPLLFKTPEGHLQLSLQPKLDDAGLKLGGDMLKSGEAKIGKVIKNVDTAREAAKAQFQQELMPTRRSIIDPQKDVTVPGSRRRMVIEQIKEIPADIIPGSPEYISLVQQIRKSIPKDLTIGELENISSSLNSQNRAFHQASLGQALGKLETARGAIDVAKERVSRQLMEEGMEHHGLGGYDRLKEVNKRIGTLIKLEDAIDIAEGAARTEAAMPHFRRHITRIGGYYKGGVPQPAYNLNVRETINEGIANAMRTWKVTSKPIPLGPEFGPMGRGRLLPERTSIDVGPVPDTSTVTGIPGQLAKGPFTGKPLTGTQQPLQPTVIRPGGKVAPPAPPVPRQSVMGLFQQRGQVIPPGSKLAFKSKTLDNKDLYHYETPDGQMITLDRELSPGMLKKPAAKPYEEGTSYKGSPYKPPPPPPRLRAKEGGRGKLGETKVIDGHTYEKVQGGWKLVE